MTFMAEMACQTGHSCVFLAPGTRLRLIAFQAPLKIMWHFHSRWYGASGYKRNRPARAYTRIQATD